MDAIRAKALYLLARRDYSRWELQQKLMQKGFDPELIEAVLQTLENENSLNETRYIGNFIRFRQGRGMGPLKIEAQLRRQGIDEDQIRRDEAWQKVNAKERAVAVREKRFGEDLPQDFSERLSQMRFLQRRGFTHEQIRAALNNTMHDMIDETTDTTDTI